MAVAQTASTDSAREVSGFVLIIALLMLFAAGKAVLHDTMDPDFFWHFRVAEQLQRDGVRPLVDQISFASSKSPWTPYSWLGELGMKWVWDHLGLKGAIAVQGMLEAGFVLLVALCCLQRRISSLSLYSGRGVGRGSAYQTTKVQKSEHPEEPSPMPSPGVSGEGEIIEPLFPVVLATTFSVFLALPYLSFRPVLGAIDIIAVCALLLLRDRKLGEQSRAVWAIPGLAILTINLHIFAFFIPMMVGALLVGAWIEHDQVKLKRYAILLCLCVMGCFCTPMLGGTLVAVREYMTSNPLTANSMIAELEPMYRGKAHQITLMFVAIVIACAMVRRSLRAGEWLWLGGMMILFVKCGRAAPLFVPIFGPVMSWSLPRLSDRALGRKSVNFGALAVVLIGAVRIGVSLPDNQRPEAWMNRQGPELPGYPTSAAEFVDAKVHRSTGKLINEFDWGGYLAWKLPQYQVLLDGRTQLYSAEFWHETYLDDRRETTKLLASVEADAAILPAGKSRFHDSLRQLGWKRVFNDARAEVMVPPTSVAGMDH